MAVDWLGELRAIRGLISYEGVATADGAAGGGTVVCSDLTLRPDYNGNLVVITSGAYIGQARDIDAATNFGTVTPHTPFGGTILAGTEFLIVALRMVPAEVADIEEKLDLVIVPDTFVYLDAGGEQAVFTFTPARNTKVNTIWLNLVNLTQNTDIRLYHQINGVAYTPFETFNWTTGMDDGVYFRDVSIALGWDLRLTIQETADETADRDIPYYYAYEPR